MKKTTLLNSHLSALVARVGHTDEIVLADAGLPIPPGPERIDLAVSPGLPGLQPILTAMLSELQLESVVLAEEIKTVSPDLHRQLLAQLAEAADAQGREIAVSYISHAAFKQQNTGARAVVRTGECTPYANIILRCGVPF
ncbi:D-ribose pyranase [Oceanisphaera arctica]|uniref:D-ribose pyranase n=1 Tax=Oceanisphaera arctica TaxID=641510 RepID=A0A2P5TMB3_9GAMM|nr:D-ribose pyranase [Oceanisphaera arctica]PPL16557.1 D-ribose pyranase [Oceanisphaera arctica]GHA11213.1 D-ribose pyranase [Oceanisphaera arctica]